MSCFFFFFLFFPQNVHLVARWLPTLDDLLQSIVENSHPDYRVFITGEAAPTPESHVIPRGILENSIKITNEPPTGMNASLHAALNNFNQVCCCSLLIAFIKHINYYKCIFFSLPVFLFLSGYSGNVCQRAGVRLHALLPLLLPRMCYRAP